MADTVLIFDTTLRDGEQAPGAAMTLADKVRIAQALAAMGVDIIEAGFPVSSPQQFDAVLAVSEAVSSPVIAALARAVEVDLNAAIKALEKAKKRRIHTFIATSDIHLTAKFGEDRYGKSLADKRKTIIRMAQDAVRMAKAFTPDVEFSAEDAGRTDVGYLREVVAAVAEAGATTINLPDTTGYCLPHEYQALFEAARKALPAGSDVIFSAHCHDDLGLATANSLAALVGGARQIECTINGIGERAGNAALEEIVMALRTRESVLNLRTNVEPRTLSETSRLVSLSTGFPVQPNKAIVGRNAFAHEAGIHQHGVLKARETYEIMRAEEVGQDPDVGIRLGRHSGRSGLFSRLTKLGVDVPEAERGTVYERFLNLADLKKEIYDQDLLLLVSQPEIAMQKPNYELKHMRVRVETGTSPEVEVTIFERSAETLHTETASGDGPVDALYAAIDAATGQPHELVTYNIRSVSEGADSVGEVTVLIGHSGAFFRGMARHTDVLQASAGAYVDALNQLEAFRADRESVRFVGEGIINAFGG